MKTKEKKAEQKQSLLEPRRNIIYGVTDRRKDPWFVKLNDFLVDHSPVSLKEKGMLFHSLQLMVRSGVKFTRAIYMIAQRTQNVRLSRVLHTIHHDMEKNGMSFSSALEKHPAVFKETETKMIKSGELTGKIEQTLHAIADQVQKNLKLELEIRKALTYPITVLIAIVIAIMIVMIFVVPKFMALFSQFDSDLPLPTQILVLLSDFVIQYWWLAILLVGLVVVWFRNWQKSRHGRRAWDGMLLQCPYIKSIVNNVQTFRIASHFSVLMSSGVSVTKSLHILAEILNNKVVADEVFQIEDRVRQGVRMSEAFHDSPHIDPVVAEVIEVGEQTGHLAEGLARTSEQYEMEVDAQLKNLTTLIEPLMLLVVAASVGFMAIAILLPIFEIQSLFGSV